MTLTETNSDTDTDNESDQDWAVETLGTSGTIAGGSDCFTVNDLDASTYTANGSGPEDYNDTSDDPNGTATVTGSGSSSNLTHQNFGDVLGVGGDISSGSLSYTVTSSETDDPTTIESGTETIADELSDGLSQTASYDVSSTLPDDATAYETGTETLGGGGTISGGSASFTWFDGNALNRDLTVSGIAATLSITEDSTDSYGFGESGTESITTGGADAPGSVSFVWDQMGTDSYVISQAGILTYIYNGTDYTMLDYSLNLTDTISSSWRDDGVDLLTDSDSLTGEIDNYTWSDLNSMAYGVSETETGFETYIHSGLESFSLADTGSESLGTETWPTWHWIPAAHSDQFDIEESFADGLTVSGPWIEAGGTLSTFATESDGFNLHDAGTDISSGSVTSDTYSYQVTQYLSDPAASGGWYESDWPPEWPTDMYFLDFQERGIVSVNTSEAFESSMWEAYELAMGDEPFTWSSTQGNLTDFAKIVWLIRPDTGVQGMFRDEDVDGGLLSVVGNDQQYVSDISSNSGSSRSDYGRFVSNYLRYLPASAPLYLFGSALDLGVAGPGYLPVGFDETNVFNFTLNTNAATANGLPTQEASSLSNMAQNQGAPDGVSRGAPPSPTATLTALAAAGRNPTDITIPTVGSEAVDPPGGSHEVPWWEGTKALGQALGKHRWGPFIVSLRVRPARPWGTVPSRSSRTGRARRFTGSTSDYATFGGAVAGDLTGTNQIAEASVGYDLATQRQLSTQERIQRGAGGTAAIAGTFAGGLGIAAKANAAPDPVRREDRHCRGCDGRDGGGRDRDGRGRYSGILSSAKPFVFPGGNPGVNRRWVEAHRIDRGGPTRLGLQSDRQPVAAPNVLRTYSRPCEGNAISVTVAGERIDSTSRHPYFVVRGDELEGRPRLEHLARVPEEATTPGRWVDATDLRVGDELLLRDGRIEKIDHVRLYAFFDTVYNFEVEDLHCYAVGWSGILVHNNNGPEGSAPQNPSRGVPDPSTPVGRQGSPLGSVQGNAPTTIGGRQYSGHAIDQMQARGVPPSAVENTIQHGVPGRPQPVGSGTTSHFDPVNNITVITDTASGRVVTVFPGR